MTPNDTSRPSLLMPPVVAPSPSSLLPRRVVDPAEPEVEPIPKQLSSSLLMPPVEEPRSVDEIRKSRVEYLGPAPSAFADPDMASGIASGVSDPRTYGEFFMKEIREGWEDLKSLPPINDAEWDRMSVLEKGLSVALPFLGGLRILFSPITAGEELVVGQPVRDIARAVGASKEEAEMAGTGATLIADLFLFGWAKNTSRFARMFTRGMRDLGTGMSGSRSEAVARMGKALEDFFRNSPHNLDINPDIVQQPLRNIQKMIAAYGDNVPPTLVMRELAKVTPHSNYLSALWSNTWEVISVPLNWKVLPTSRGVKTSVADVVKETFQPAVERLEKYGLDRPFRSARAQQQLVMSVGEELGSELKSLNARERFDVIRGMLGGRQRTYRGKLARASMLEKISELRLDSNFRREYLDDLSKRLSRLELPAVDDESARRSFYRFIDKVDKQLDSNASPREIRKNIARYIEDPNTPTKHIDTLKQIYNLTADVPQEVARAATHASRSSAARGLIEMGGVADEPIKNGVLITKKDLPSFPSLHGKYAMRDVYLELKAWEDVPKYSRSIINRMLLTPWKVAKTILRPAAHIRNIVSNFIMNDIGGLPAHRLDVYMRSLYNMSKNTPLWREFKRLTGARGTFSAHDVAVLSHGERYGANWLDWAFATFDKIVAPASRLYDAEEQMFKFAKYIHNISKGMLREDAALDAMKWTLNYSEVTRAVAFTRANIAPFFTWQSKILPLVGTAVKNHPLRVAKWFAVYEALQLNALESLDMNAGEWQFLHSILPDYIANGQFLLLPTRDEKGRLQILNLTFMIPGFGDLAQVANDPISSFIGNPMITIGGALLSNKGFSGNPIWYDWEEPSTKFAKAMGFVWQQIMPSWVPGGQDRVFEKIAQIRADHPDAPTPTQLVGSLLGYKIHAFDEGKLMKRRAAMDKIALGEMKTDFMRKVRDASAMGDNEEVQSVMERYSKLRELYLKKRRPEEHGHGPTLELMRLIGKDEQAE